MITTDGRKKNGGIRLSAGRKPIEPEEKKVTVPFQIKKKHIETARAKIQPIVDKLNSK